MPVAIPPPRPAWIPAAEALFHEEFYLPFANQAAFERLMASAKKLVNKYLSDDTDDL